MLPSTHRDPYQKFQQVLQEMPESAVAIDLEKQLLPEKFQSLQQLFENEIATLSADDISRIMHHVGSLYKLSFIGRCGCWKRM
jgi:hypothetical protein